MVALPDLADGGFRTLVVAEACPEELVQLFEHVRGHLVLTVFAELLHQIRDELVVAGEEIEQALQITGDENVHRGGHCLVEGAAAVIAARAQEVGQHIVGVGRAHELADGKAHLPGKVAREDIAEVAGRHDVVDLVSRLDAARLHEVGVRSIIIDDLRGEAADVDGVGRGQANALTLEQLILADGGEDFLHAGLRIVEVAAYRAHADVFARLRRHLRLLHGAHAAVGVEDDDLRARHIAEALHRRLAGVAGRGGQDHDLVVHTELFFRRGHQARQHRERHILKSARRPAEKLEDEVLTDGDGRGQVVGLKLAGIAVVDEFCHLRF